MAKVFKTLKKKAQATPLVGVILDSLKSENPRQNAPSIQSVLDNLQPKQHIINPDFQIWQRGEELTSTINTKNYLCDMWYILDSGRITVKKVDNGLKIVNYNSQDARLSQNIEIEVGKKYTLVTSINGEVHSLEIVGGTYTENSFMGYSLHSGKERIYVVGNTDDVINYCDLWEGDIAYPHVRNKYAYDLMECQRKLLVKTISSCGADRYKYGKASRTFSYLGHIQISMDSVPNVTIDTSDCVYDNCEGIGAIVNGTYGVSISATVKNDGIYRAYGEGKIIISCEPL